MKRIFTVDGAICMCKFGTAPGILKIIDQHFVHVNGKKLAATTLNLGDVFQPPGFAVCRATWPPRPCTPAVTGWTLPFEKVKINRMASILTNESMGTCASGCPDCISFVTNGQFALPGVMQLKDASGIFQGDLDPVGESLALNENQIGSLLKIETK